MSMSLAVGRALYGKMAGDTTLNNLLGTPPTGYSKSIYYEIAPEGAGFPYVIFQKQSGAPRYAMSKAKLLENDLWTIKGVDRQGTGTVAETIAARLDALLTDGTISISGATQLYLRRESDVDYPEDRNGVQYVHTGSMYRLQYQRDA